MKEQRHGQDTEDEMSKACDMYGEAAATQDFGEETWRKQATWKT